MLFLFFWGFVYSINAQDTLTLEQAIDIALKNNISILIHKNNERIAGNNNSIGNAGYLPNLDIRANHTSSTRNVNQEFLQGNKVERDGAASRSLSALAEVNWRLFDGMRMFNTKQLLETISESANEELKSTMEKIVLQVYEMYFDLVKHNKILIATDEAIAFSEERLRIFNEKYQLGSASKLDYLQAKVYLNNDKSDRKQIEQQIFALKATLNEALAREPEIDFLVEDTINLVDKLDYNSLHYSAISKNKELIIAEKNIAAARSEIKIAESLFYPNIDIFANYELSDLHSESGFMIRNTSFSLNYGINFSLNLFNGFNTLRQSQNASIMLDNYELLYSQIKIKIKSELNRAYQRYSKQLEIVALENENVSVARQALDIAYEQLKLGSFSPLELREAQMSYVIAQSRLVTARFNAKISEAELLKISGMLVHGNR